MQPGLSTYVFFQHRLHPGLLDALHAACVPNGGTMTIEVCAARHHFDYTDAESVREIAAWFRSSDVRAVLHQPIYITDRADTQWSRHVAPNPPLRHLGYPTKAIPHLRVSRQRRNAHPSRIGELRCAKALSRVLCARTTSVLPSRLSPN